MDGIVTGDDQFATIEGTRVRVKDIVAQYPQVLDEIVAERMHQGYWPHLTREQIEAAISYWRKHPEQITEEMRIEKEFFEKNSKD